MARINALATGFCAAALLTAGTTHAQTADRQLAARIQRIEDTAAIERLLLEYGRALDARDFKAYSLLFAKDGVWSGGMGTVQGPAAIQAFMEKAIPGPNNTAVVGQSGRYDDTLVREDGRWKFKRRVAANDIPRTGPSTEELKK